MEQYSREYQAGQPPLEGKRLGHLYDKYWRCHTVWRGIGRKQEPVVYNPRAHQHDHISAGPAPVEANAVNRHKGDPCVGPIGVIARIEVPSSKVLFNRDLLHGHWRPRFIVGIGGRRGNSIDNLLPLGDTTKDGIVGWQGVVDVHDKEL